MPPLRSGIDRRAVLTVLSTAAATTACAPPEQPNGTYVSDAAALGDPGEVTRYATTLSLSGYGRGALALVRDNRPIKIEGNPHHPASLGGTDAFGEAAILDLFDPQRSRAPRNRGALASWVTVAGELQRRLDDDETTAGEGLRLLTGRITSPTALRQIALMQTRFPEMRWARWESIHDDNAQAGMQLAFGRRLDAVSRLADARQIVALDADFLGPGPDQMRIGREFARARLGPHATRLTVFEPSLTATGVCADTRVAATPNEIADIAVAIARALGADLSPPALPVALQQTAARAARYLQRSPGAIAIVGWRQPAQVHALCAWINHVIDAPVDYIEPVDPHPNPHGASLNSLTRDLVAGRVSTLIALQCNPCYSAPAALNFARAMTRAQKVFHFGGHYDETARRAHAHGPLSHELESWSDARAPTGEASLVQPVVAPFYDTRTTHEVLALLSGDALAGPADPVHSTWSHLWGADFPTRWRETLSVGLIDQNASPPIQLAPPQLPQVTRANQREGWTLVLSPSAQVWDGANATNAWLQECPDPITKETWGASLRIGADDARRLGARDGDVVMIGANGGSIAAPVRLVSGQARSVIALPLGYGRRASGPVGDGLGADANQVRDAEGGAILRVTLERTPRHDATPSTQRMFALEGDLANLYPLVAPGEARAAERAEAGLVDPEQNGERAWAMVIDNATCIGCNACVLACQAENNLAIIGPDEMARERDMHWMRIDRFEGTGERPGGFQPTPCMHCEQAPCEPVCPVEASVHDSEGLNLQVYNRCIGTRFCQANCPYKVRRFNYDDYSHPDVFGALDTASITAQRNPEVTVRNRGVMEKCTYCVQRISAARRRADIEDRPIADGEVVTACQSACPTRAIHFGDRNDARTEVASLQADPRRHVLLEHVGTRPRTTYLARLWKRDEM